MLALNLPASSAGVNYQFSQGNYICVPNLYSSSGAHAIFLHALHLTRQQLSQARQYASVEGLCNIGSLPL